MAGGQESARKRRIKSVQSTKKITKAMELISASRIAKAQERVAAARPDSERITDVIRHLAAAGAGRGSALLQEREQVSTVALVVISADRGLCGGYNTTVIRATRRPIPRLHGESKQPPPPPAGETAHPTSHSPLRPPH